MKLRSLLFTAILSLIALPGAAQIEVIYSNGFETNEAADYTSSGSVGFSTTMQSSGSRSLKLTQEKDGVVTVELPMLDFTTESRQSLNFIALEFDHFCNVETNTGATAVDIARIYYKRGSQTNWTQISQGYVGESPYFDFDYAFHRESYDEWSDGAESTDEWKAERFDLNSVFQGVSANERTLYIKFELNKRTRTGAVTGTGWWLDNVRVRASQQQMLNPTLVMVDYPDGGYLANSRMAKISLAAYTSLQQGINNDSVYMVYQYGANAPQRVMMTPDGTFEAYPGATVRNKYSGVIPFAGYDTLVRFYCVVKDGTVNENSATFPAAVGGWSEFRFCRGVEQMATSNATTIGNTASFPFGPYADNKAEMLYDSAYMASQMQGPGAITELRFIRHSTGNAYTRTDFTVKMKNYPTDYAIPTTNPAAFTASFAKLVYSGDISVAAGSAGDTIVIPLDDTFYYAGRDLMVQTIFNDATDLTSGVAVRTISVEDAKRPLTYVLGQALYQFNPYTATDFMAATDKPAYRPLMLFRQHANKPLYHDMGVGSIVYPTGEVAMTNQPGETIRISLNNFGSLPANAIRVSYLIDGTQQGHYDWSGTMAGLAANANLEIANNIHLEAGFHTLKVWVEDTITASGVQYRDHEPLNDTSYVEFIVCAGAMSGVRNIGGTNADYNTIEEFLFSLWQCGVDGPLTVRLADGVYPPFTMPVVPGMSATNYIQFEGMGSGARIVSSGQASNVVDASAVAHMRFRNLTFERSAGALQSMVKLAATSTDMRFSNCTFIDQLANPTTAMRITAVLANNGADSMVVDSCTFNGGNVAVSYSGVSSLVHSHHASVTNSTFSNQYQSAVRFENMTDVLLDNNTMNDVLSNNFVVLLNGVDGTTRITKNRIYSTHGASGIGLAGLVGTQSNHALVANNFVVAADNGTASSQASPLSVQQTTWTDVVYNSVKLTAPQRSNVPAATFGSNGNIENSTFVNNILATFDTRNFALLYSPGSVTTATVSHNVYYSEGAILNRYGMSNQADLNAWTTAVPSDEGSVSANPEFVESTPFDLRTYNRAVWAIGTPIASVGTDIFDEPRSEEHPCPGAFEFEPLHFDFALEAVLQPVGEDCQMPDEVEVVLVVRNIGIEALPANAEEPLQIGYSVNGTTTGLQTITDSIPAEDTATVATGIMLHLPTNGLYDSTYNITLWTVYADDPNQTNDTVRTTVVSRYTASAPTPFLDSTAYNTSFTLNITEGVDQWTVYDAANAPMQSSVIYWYADSITTTPFHVGNSYTTPALRNDTTFYIRQHREVDMVRMTQVVLPSVSGQVGATSPTPSWYSQSSMGIQFTNMGDAEVSLMGDTLYIISDYNNSFYKKAVRITDNVVLQPGQSMVFCFKSGSMNANAFYSSQSFKPTSVKNFAFVFRHQGATTDAVVFNNVQATTTLANNWASCSVPTYVWDGAGLDFGGHANSAGVIRKSFTGTAADWEFATAASPMFIDQTDPAWVRYEGNSCLGHWTTATITMIQPPRAEPEISNLELPGGCGVSEMQISVDVTNYGSQPLDSISLSYSALAQTDTVTEVFHLGINPAATRTYTFTQRLNTQVPYDSVVGVSVWVNDMGRGNLLNNDTIQASSLVLFSPSEVPALESPQSVYYGRVDTVHHVAPEGLTTVWISRDGDTLGRGNFLVTPPMYEADTVMVAYQGSVSRIDQVGTGTSTTSNSNAYCSPYQLKQHASRQQYIYTASDLLAAGVQPGRIGSIAFYFEDFIQLLSNTDTTLRYSFYEISLGTTAAATMTTSSMWKETPQVVYTSNNFTLGMADRGTWVTHTFSSPFDWDGTSNIVVQVAYIGQNLYAKSIKTRYVSKSNTCSYANSTSDTISPAGIRHYTTSASRNGNRPQAKFESYELGCNGPSAPLAIAMYGQPTVDANISWAVNVDTLEYTSCTNVSPMVNVRNQGADTMTSIDLVYTVGKPTYDSVYSLDEAGSIVATPVLHRDTTHITTPVPPSTTVAFPLFNTSFAPGRYALTVVASAEDDTISINDTIHSMFTVRFCGGVYTVELDGSGDFHSLTEAIDTMNIVATDGPITFNIGQGTFDGQVLLGSNAVVRGQYPFEFHGMGDSTIISSSQSGYVFKVNGIDNVTFTDLKMASTVTGNSNAHVLVVSNMNGLTLENVTLSCRYHETDVASTCLQLGGNISAISINNSTFERGGSSIAYTGNTTNYGTITITNSNLHDFQGTGLKLKGLEGLTLEHSDVRSSAVKDSRALTAIDLENLNGTLSMQNNLVYLSDSYKGGKIGLTMKNVVADEFEHGVVVNNMIAVHHGNDASVTPYGIYVDGTSSNLDFYFNSVRIDASGSKAKTSAAFYANTNTTHLNIMNNIFANFGTGTNAGYAYYIKSGASVDVSNHNDYYAGGSKFVYWGGDVADITVLQALNEDDNPSYDIEPYFVNDTNLHLVMTNLGALGLHNLDYPLDIDGRYRQAVPGPTIGAHEVSRCAHDLSIVRVLSPVLPVDINNPTDIETDPIIVSAEFYNNGSNTESGVRWFAYLCNPNDPDRTPIAMSDTVEIGNFLPSISLNSTTSIIPPLGVVDTQMVVIEVIYDSMAVDCDATNNINTTYVFLSPAFNAEATKVSTTLAGNKGCSLYEVPVILRISNKGKKTIAEGDTLRVGYRAELKYGTGTGYTTDLTFPQFPIEVEETLVLDDDILAVSGVFGYYDYTFNTTADLYPYDTSLNIKVDIVAWVKHPYDLKPLNDTTSSPLTVQSFYKPNPPVGHDTTLAYATWGQVTAEQDTKLAINWYRATDTSAVMTFSSNTTANYNNSTRWKNTPVFYSDSTYLLQCKNTEGCLSDYGTVHVHTDGRKTADVGVGQVLNSMGNRVYMENDTVRVSIFNYGTSAQSSIPITYQVKQGNTIHKTVTETCTQNIPAGGSVAYTFSTLIDSLTPNKTYKLTVWTDLANDGTRRNDTIRLPYTSPTVAPKQEVEFKTKANSYSGSITTAAEFVIERVTFSEVDFELPAMERTYTDLGTYPNPEVPVIHVFRGFSDSIHIELGNIADIDLSYWAKVAVYVDFDRSGTFTAATEAAMAPTNCMAGRSVSGVVTIPASASYGYMKMRVIALPQDASASDFTNPSSATGHMVDFLLFVDPNPRQKDMAVSQLVGPRDYLVRDDNARTVVFRLSNLGQQTVNSAEVYYRFHTEEGDTEGNFTWTGTLNAGNSALSQLPPFVCPLGTTEVNIWTSYPGDNNRANDTLKYEYHRFHTIECTSDDDFEQLTYWYAPKGTNEYTRNYWELGTPGKTKLNSAHSGENAWATGLTSPIQSGSRGNTSYLYSPIISLSNIRMDTIAFYMARNFGTEDFLQVDFLDYEGIWRKIERDSLTDFYNNDKDHIFDKDAYNTGAWRRYYISTSGSGLNGDFPEKVQFRFTFRANAVSGGNATTNFGEGCAIDDIRVARAQQRTDAGVIEILEPESPIYGETVYPRVVVQNFGFDTIRSLRLGYTCYGAFLANYSTFDVQFAPGAIDTFTYTTPIVVSSDFPTEFDIKAFTNLSADIYYDNDTAFKHITLSPMAADIAAIEFVRPLDQVVAGDSVVVAMRVLNFGSNPIPSATFSYIYNRTRTITEFVDFEEVLGEPLQSMQYFTYTFNTKVRASMGNIDLTGIVKSDSNQYIYNDTIEKHIQGVTSIRDLAAVGYVVDTIGNNQYHIGLVFDNVGSLGVSGFEVGFWLGDDSLHRYRATYTRMLPAFQQGYYLCDTTVRNLTANRPVHVFVNDFWDADPENDTSSVRLDRRLDLVTSAVVIEENQNANCRVFVEVANWGNIPIENKNLSIQVTINGTNISYNTVRSMPPGVIYLIEMPSFVPKNSQRHYVGSGSVMVDGDDYLANNETTVVRVANMVENGIDDVTGIAKPTLMQNRPNPFTGITTIGFTLPKAAKVDFFLLDQAGRQLNGFGLQGEEGDNSVSIDMSGYPSGIYYYGIVVDGYRLIRKLVLR